MKAHPSESEGDRIARDVLRLLQAIRAEQLTYPVVPRPVDALPIERPREPTGLRVDPDVWDAVYRRSA